MNFFELPFQKANGDLNIERSWLLPVLKENIKSSTLEYFVKGILPLAIFCQKRSTELAEANDGIGAHSSELLYLQLWNLLPCFCNHPTDIKENFKVSFCSNSLIVTAIYLLGFNCLQT